jgi:C-terminal processing protease CtpA/Prc
MGFHEFHHGSRTCYWQYNSFTAPPAGTRVVDAVFQDIQDHNAEDLIIDLRFNGGGNSLTAEHILSYISPKPYRIYSGSDTKISRQVPANERFGALAFLMRGRVLTSRAKNGLKTPRDIEHRFRGKVYAIIGPYTFSAASDFAHALKDFEVATLIGEETGGLRKPFGNSPSFQMPHSGLQFSVSTSRYYAPLSRPDDDTRGTVPDIPINDELLAPFMDANDPVLAFILDLTKNQPARKDVKNKKDN